MAYVQQARSTADPATSLQAVEGAAQAGVLVPALADVDQVDTNERGTDHTLRPVVSGRGGSARHHPPDSGGDF
ncbi:MULTISPECIES: hypothetical protein [unclassified Streptomyces]|uniref:hypothetical protein n=1 Tax=unclassified Streptomyces TaxID=2593676 RepID=UPI0033CBC819